MSIFEKYGGGGGAFAHGAVVSIEQVRALAPSFGGMLHSGIIARYINGHGTDGQKLKWLPSMASGEVITAIALTESGTGSDPQALKTKAVKDGEDYVISGAKTFISNGQLADLVIVAA
jgi:acyl-CoA dehydrogenase